MNADRVCRKYTKNFPKLTVRVLKNDGDDLILLEGNRRALAFLAELIAAVSTESSHTKFEISPNGAGSIFFARDATAGLYIELGKRSSKKKTAKAKPSIGTKTTTAKVASDKRRTSSKTKQTRRRS